MNVSALATDFEAQSHRGGSARRLFWRLITIYLLASAAAVALTLLLGLLGLEFTPRQWVIFWMAVPFAVVFYTSFDLIAIRRHFAPIAGALNGLDSGPRPDDLALGAALVRALNLPQMSAKNLKFSAALAARP